MDPKVKVRQFLASLLARKADHQPFADDSSLLLSGRLQSIDAVSLAVFLEEQFGVDFSDLGFDQERLDSVNSVMSLIGTD